MRIKVYAIVMEVKEHKGLYYEPAHDQVIWYYETKEEAEKVLANVKNETMKKVLKIKETELNG